MIDHTDGLSLKIPDHDRLHPNRSLLFTFALKKALLFNSDVFNMLKPKD